MKYFFLIPFLLFNLSAPAQYFSGEILYKTTIVPKNDTVNVDAILSGLRGDMSSYLITDHYYKSTSLQNGKPTYSYTYHGDTKRMYDAYPEGEYITFRDSRKAGKTTYETSTIHRDSTKTILGYDTYMAVHPASFGTTKSYYSDDLQVNYETFKEHAVANWYNKLKTVKGSIPLKSITEYEDHIRIREAVKVTPRVVAPAEFDLPANVPIVAGGPALDKQPVLTNQNSTDLTDCFFEKATAAEDIIAGSELNKIFLTAILSKDGTLSKVEAHEKDSAGLWEVAEDILMNCGFAFTPGEIDGIAVDSQIYIPLAFK